MLAVLVNCRNANSWPAAPEPRSARMVSAEVGQPPASIEGQAAGSVGIGAVLLGGGGENGIGLLMLVAGGLEMWRC